MATIVDSWALVDTKEITLIPGEEEVAKWQNVAELTITLKPGTGEIDRWKLVATKLITLSVPTVACSTDADCPEGYVCENGVCVKKEGAFPWTWLVISGGAAAGVILIASGIAGKRKIR